MLSDVAWQTLSAGSSSRQSVRRGRRAQSLTIWSAYKRGCAERPERGAAAPMRCLGASALTEGARRRRCLVPGLRACTTLCGGDAYPDTQDLAQPRHGSGGHVYHPL